MINYFWDTENPQSLETEGLIGCFLEKQKKK